MPHQYIGRHHTLALIHPPELSLVKMAGQKVCRLCATTEHVIIGQNLAGSSQQQQKMLNLKSEMRAEYVLARQGSYGLHDPTRKGGSDEGEEKPEKRAWLSTEGCIFFGRCLCHSMESIKIPL